MSTSTNRNGHQPRRVLHLVDGFDEAGTPLVGDVLHDILRHRPDDLVVSVGGNRGADNLLRLVPARRRLLGVGDGGLKRLLRHIEEATGAIDAVHAWGIRGTALLGQCSPDRILVSSLDGFQADAPEAQTAATVLRTGRVESLLGSYRTQRLISTVVGAGTRRSGRDRVACPVVNPDCLANRSDDLRERWGAGPDSLVIGLIGSPMDQLDLRDQSGLPVRCSLLGRHVITVVSSRGARRGDLVRWMERACPQVQLVFDDIMDRTVKVARSLDFALAPSAIGRQTRVCDVAPVMTVVAAGHPVVLGVEHPAAEYADREELIRAGGEHDEHDSTRWLVDRLSTGAGNGALERSQKRLEGYCQAIEQLYARAASALGQSWSAPKSAMAAS